MITYTAFDPDDASGVSYRWYGGEDTTVYVYSDGAEVDAFALPDGAPTDVASVQSAVAAHHEAHRTYRSDHDERDDSPVDLGLDLELD